MGTIVFDIEVAGFGWEEVDEITRGYLLGRARDEGEREAVPERTGLTLGLGRVIAIGMWSPEQDRGLVLLEGPPAPQKEWEKVQRSEVFRGSEVQLLERFWSILEKKRAERGGVKLVSFHGREYDGPVLMTRSAQLGLRPSANLCTQRYDLSFHCDLMDVLTWQGAWRERYKLDYWCRRFGIESPKGGLDGSQVTRAWREGRLEEIGEYCLRDVRATCELYLKLKETLLPLFRGG